MASTANHWKLGLFVLGGLAVGCLGIVVLGASRFDKETLPFVTYFDESVQGLELGSPVKFRGVQIGKVSHIGIGPQRRRVEVTCEVNLAVLDRLGLRPTNNVVGGEFVPADMRVQLVSPGITGVKFVQADFFDPKDHPPPGLPFPTPANYIPATPSTLKSIEESVVHTLAEFPDILERVRTLLTSIEKAVGDADVKGISAGATRALDDADIVLRKANDTLDTLDLTKMAANAQAALDGLNETMDKATDVLDRLVAADGLIDDLERVAKKLRTLELGNTLEGVDEAVAAADESATAIGDVARDANNLGRDLEQTLEAIRLAAESIRRLADTLERDSDMLLKGRAKGSE
jgi:paraquat-inducible protein B